MLAGVNLVLDDDSKVVYIVKDKNVNVMPFAEDIGMA